jgi:hypothetical protein
MASFEFKLKTWINHALTPSHRPPATLAVNTATALVETIPPVPDGR